MTLQYDDFDLAIQKQDSGYRARVLNSPGGQGSTNFTLPFSEMEIENLLLKMGHVRGTRRGRDSSQMEAAKKFGGALFRAVFADDVGRCWQSSTSTAASKENGLRLRLRLSDAAELANLPWEFLYDPSLDRFFNHSVETPLVRFLDLPSPPRPFKTTLPLKLLVMISLPEDEEALAAEQEWRNLKQAVEELEGRGLIVVERIDDATLAALQTRLRRGVYHIFHYVGHGAFDVERNESVLLFEGAQGRAKKIGGQMLGTLLRDHKSLRLVVLNACEGGRAALDDPFSGVAQNLIRQGIPAVVAMQFAISDDAALKLSSEFYKALADNYPIDAAVSEARKAIYLDGNEVEWATPVLYSRAPDGVIFDLKGAPAAPETKPAQITDQPKKTIPAAQTETLAFDVLMQRAERLGTQGERILADTPVEQEAWLPKFQEAFDYLERAQKLQPDNPRVLYALAQVRARLVPPDLATARTLARRVEDLLDGATDAQEKRLLADAYFLHATLGEPPNGNLLTRAGNLYLGLNDLEMTGLIRKIMKRLENPNYLIFTDLYGKPDVRFRSAEVQAQAAAPVAIEPKSGDLSAVLFNPVGRWNFQVQDETESRMVVELFPNGTFQMAQQVGLYQVPINGAWSFNALTQNLTLSGVVNTFQSLALNLTITPLASGAFTATGADGVSYILTRA
ncbi:MAG: CHAT domain-containing protein [Chloroflexi bacterium]|nr:CHAT domain-containing protein [Chloroflexota bacterium]